MTAAVVATWIKCGISSGRSNAGYGLQDYGFVGVVDCARVSCCYGMRDYGLF